ncbi:DNA polymerase III subunit beta [Gemmata sp. JC717]|uniref:DNA polymerase III subunit beta n=1 Tax=Gemmata algarum TaxID=2975278 RepID=UPI0021BA60EA|nr:DNA polymerase III subunit beta [Gemmata algarum]MDY3555784.1 DNA polymerase III subunit beta [Gemmata algarum]
MKVTCQRDSLFTACQLVQAAVAQRTTKPVLSNIKAVAQDDAITLVAYDTEVGIRYELRGITVARAGSCILPITELVKILRESSDPEISLDAGKEAVVAKTSGGKFEMPSLDVNEFPDIPEFDDGGRYHEITAGVLRAMLRRTSFAADKKDTTARFSLTGVLWEADGKEARLVATDTKRLAVCKGEAVVYGVVDDVKAIHVVPLKAVTLLEKNLTDDGETVRVGLRANDALFKTERATIYTSLVQGKFPPYRDIIGKTTKEATQKVPLPVQGFLSRVRQAAIMTDDESMRVDMTFDPGSVVMKARGAKTGASEVTLELPDYDGPHTEIAFDPSYLVEFLRAIENEPTVVLEMSTGTRAALFTCGDNYSYLVMPLTG